MTSSPNPGVSPTEPSRDIEPEVITPQGPDVLGSNIGEKQPKPFNLPEQKKSQTESAQSLMEFAQSGQKINPQEISTRISQINDKFNEMNSLLKKTNQINLVPEQKQDLKNLMGGLHEDLRVMGKMTNSEYNPQKDSENDSPTGLLKTVLDFVQGGQSQFNKALQYLGNIKNPNPADMLRLSYTVQRASQKTELFSSIISSGVSGIKSIMGTQLG